MLKKSYNIKVILDEIRDLKLYEKASDELANPWIVVETCGFQKQTKQYLSKINLTLQTVFLFDNILLDEKQFNEGLISFKIYHKYAFYSYTQTVGQCYLDMTAIYARPNHELIGKWLIIARNEKPKVIFGYLKVNVWIIGENDQMPAYDLQNKQEKQEDDEDGLQKNDDDLGQLTIASPKIDREPYIFILNVYKANGINDAGNMQVYPQVEINFNGQIQVGEAGGNSSPDWKDSFEFPFYVPTLIDKCTFKMYSANLFSRKLLAQDFVKVKEILEKPMPPTWINLYGNEKDDYFFKLKNDYFQQKYLEDNVWSGRILISANSKSYLNPELRKRKAPEIIQPEEMDYQIWIDFYELVGLTFLDCTLELCIGVNRLPVKTEKLKKDRYTWGPEGRIPSLTMKLPRDQNQIPDIFVNAYSGGVRVAYVRIPIDVIIQKGIKVKVEWKELKLLDYEQPREQERVYCLCSVNMGSAYDFDKPRPIRLVSNKAKYEVWCRIIQAKHLKSMQSDGKNNAYVGITINGKFKRSKTYRDCLSPTWNDLVRFRTKFFSNLEISGNIEITLYNETSVYKAHDHCGSFFINPSEIRLASDYKEKMPEAKWNYLYKNGKYTGGAILTSFMLHKLKNSKKIEKPELTLPKMKKCNLRLYILGVRKMQAVFLQNVQSPFINVDLALHKEEQARVWRSNKGERIKQKADANFQFNEYTNMIDIELPENHLFSPSLDIRVEDERSFIYGGTQNAGSISINLNKYLPWITPSLKQKLEQQEKKYNEGMLKIDGFDPLEEQIEIKDVQDEKKALEEAEKLIQAEALKDKDENQVQDEEDIFLLPDTTASNFVKAKIMILDTTQKEKFQQLITEDQIDNEEEENITKVDNWMGDDDQGISRPELQGGYEAELPEENLPYEIFKLYRTEGSETKQTGIIKLKIKIIKQEKGVPFDETDDQLEIFKTKVAAETGMVARLYLLNSNHLKCRHQEIYVDAFVWIATSESDSEYRMDKRIFVKNNDPEIMTVYKIGISLPDQAYLKIGMWDKGEYNSLIGSTEIDLENRWFHPKYQAIVDNGQIKDINIERRSLYCDGYKGPQGSIRMWLEILSYEDDSKYPPEDLQPLNFEKFELRLVIWNTKDIPFPGSSINQKIRCILVDDDEGEMIRNTDIHYNSKDGTAEFNWRMKFRIRLPSSSPKITLQILSTGLTSEDGVAEANIDLSSLYQEVHRKKTSKKLPANWVAFSNPSSPGKNMGSVNIELWILPQNEADQGPVGDERQDPNKLPYLATPESGRNMFEMFGDLPSFAFPDFGSMARNACIFLVICFIGYQQLAGGGGGEE